MSIHIKRCHGTAREDAKARVTQIAERLRSHLSARYRWEGDTLRFERSGAKGEIRIDDQDVEIRVELGLLLRPLEAGIRASIEEQLAEVLRG
jgi:putative polyhydroxyalkanoate system protein